MEGKVCDLRQNLKIVLVFAKYREEALSKGTEIGTAEGPSLLFLGKIRVCSRSKRGEGGPELRTKQG